MAIIGIDLGTTNSCTAVLQGDEPVIIVNSEGERVTPSVVAFGRNGERLIGNPAKRQAIVNPANTVYSVKRFIGRAHGSQAIQSCVDHFPFALTKGGKGDVRISIDGKAYSPEELSAMILAKMKAEAEDFLQEPVEQAVVTVPAYFDDRQRSATKDAGRIAGLEILRIINEPTAAALAYGVQREGNRVLAVYDLGGGTFDISILEQRGLDFRVLATAGDNFLGGDDFDQVLIEWLVEKFEAQSNSELPREATILQRLKNAAENAKKDLSFSEATQVTIPFLTGSPSGGPLHLDIEFLRAQFDHLVEPLVERTLLPCRTALEDAGLTVDQIDGVLLVGGQTRSPIVQAAVQEFFGKAPIKGINPEEAVAMGAAITAGMGTEEMADVRLADVTPLSLGIETAGGAVSKIIPRNTPIPTVAEKTFTTTTDDQLIIRVHVLQGEREMAEDNRSLGFFDLVGVRPAAKGVTRIAIRFEIDEEGIVHVTARDDDTGRQQSIQIRNAGGLSEREIERMVTDAASFHADDERAREWVALRNRAMNLVYSSQRMLDDPGVRLEVGYRDVLIEKVGVLDKLLSRDADQDDLDPSVTDLLEYLKQIRYDEEA